MGFAPADDTQTRAGARNNGFGTTTTTKTKTKTTTTTNARLTNTKQPPSGRSLAGLARLDERPLVAYGNFRTQFGAKPAKRVLTVSSLAGDLSALRALESAIDAKTDVLRL